MKNLTIKKSFVLAVQLLLTVFSLVGAADAQPIVTVYNSSISPGEKIIVEFSGISNPASQDWISIYKIGTPNERYGEWYYLQGRGTGSLTFTAPNKKENKNLGCFLTGPQVDIRMSQKAK